MTVYARVHWPNRPEDAHAESRHLEREGDAGWLDARRVEDQALDALPLQEVEDRFGHFEAFFSALRRGSLTLEEMV